MEHSGENYGLVMLGIVFAALGAPMITSIVVGKGYGMHTVFAAVSYTHLNGLFL